MGYLDKAKSIHANLFPKEAAQVIPCTNEEVALLEETLDLKLPKAYQEFLLWMGKYGGDFWTGYAGFYHEIDNINSWARELLQESSSKLSLPQTAFVFYWDYAQLFYFFLMDAGDDPTVYVFIEPNLAEVIRQDAKPSELSPAQSYMSYLFNSERNEGFGTRAPSFSECLASEIEGHALIRISTGYWRDGLVVRTVNG